MNNYNNIIKGSLGINRGTGGLILCIIGIIFTMPELKAVFNNFDFEYLIKSFSIKSPIFFLLFCLIGFFLFFYFCTTENYSISFTEDSLLTKSYFINTTKKYSYDRITKISINGRMLPYSQKYMGVRMEIEYSNNGFKQIEKYRLKNFDSNDLNRIMNNFKEKKINYNYNPDL